MLQNFIIKLLKSAYTIHVLKYERVLTSTHTISMFCNKIRKMFIPAHPVFFFYLNVGVAGIHTFHGHVFPDVFESRRASGDGISEH